MPALPAQFDLLRTQLAQSLRPPTQPTKDAVSRARSLEKFLGEKGVPMPPPVADATGGLDIAWLSGDLSIAVTISAKGRARYSTFDMNTCKAQRTLRGPSDPEIADALLIDLREGGATASPSHLDFV